MIVILLVAAGVGIFSYTAGPCTTAAVDSASTAIESFNTEFYENVRLGGDTDRINLGPPVMSLKEIQLELEDLDVPVCLEDAKSSALLSMKNAILAFLTFMDPENPEEDVSAYLDLFFEYQTEARLEIERVQKCAPFCY